MLKKSNKLLNLLLTTSFTMTLNFRKSLLSLTIMSLNRLKKHIALFVLSIILSGCYAFKHGWQQNDYEKMGWMEVDFKKTQGKTGINRLQSEMKLYSVVKHTIDTEGYPDHLKVNLKSIIHLAYIDKGHVITLHAGGFDGRFIGKKHI